MEHISGQYIKHLREERGLTLRSFAEQIYASKSSVYRWEQVHVPENEDILQRIAAVFGTDVAALREGSAQFTARQAAERAVNDAADTALHRQATAEEAPTEDTQNSAEKAVNAVSSAQIAAEKAQGGAAGAAEEAQAEGDDDFGLDPDQVAEMKFGIKWLGWAIGLLAAAALVSMAVFAAL